MVTVISRRTGYNNQVYVCSNTKTVKEPRKVVIRKYGGNSIGNKDTLRPLTTTQELILVCELANRNLAPKLFGFFDGGRIEEYIDSHQMTEEEASTSDIETDLAKNIARFHAVDNVPFPKPGYDYSHVLRVHFREASEGIKNILQNKDLSEVHHIVQHNWEGELDWLSPLVSEDKHRIVLMHWDIHLQNIGVRNTVTDGGLKTILYDYEMVAYQMRGKDIGLFLMSKIGLIATTDMKAEDIDFPSEEECRLFVQEYMIEAKQLFEDWNEQGMDNFDHIMMESIIGGMVSAICFLFACAHNYQQLMVVNPEFVKGVCKRMNACFFACKRRFETSYPNYKKEL